MPDSASILKNLFLSTKRLLVAVIEILMKPLLSTRQRVMVASFTCVLFCVGLVAYNDFRETNRLRFVVDLETSVSGFSQVFYDVGSGYNEADSCAITVQNGHSQKRAFSLLPSKAIRSIRFDPINVSAVVRIKDVRIENKQGDIIKKFPLQDCRAMQQISKMDISEGALIIHTIENANDPIILIENSSIENQSSWSHFIIKRGWIIIGYGLPSFLFLIGLIYSVIFARHNEYIVGVARSLKIYSFDLRVVTLLVALVSVICVSSEFNTYSLAVWRSYLDGSPAQEIMVGQARPIRSDDWVLDLPLALSQLKSPQPFSTVNPNIGIGQQMFVPFKTPAYSSVLLFRPSVWGFFLGPDIGISWMWVFMVLGLFYSSFLLLKVITENAFLTFWGSIVVTTSPYFLAWNYHTIESVIHGFFVFALLVFLTRKQTALCRILISLFLGWSLTCMILNYLYPAKVIVAIYLVIFLFAGWILEKSRWQEVQWRSFAKSLVPALIVFGLGVMFFFWEALPWIQAIRNTTYPGQRVSTGGGMQLWRFFVEHYLIPLFISWKHLDWGALVNECEASSFYLFFPLVGAIVVMLIIRQSLQGVSIKKILSEHGLQISLLLLVASLLFYAICGIPLMLAKLTFLGMTTANRVIVGIGIASMIMLIAFLRDGSPQITSKKIRLLLICGWSLIWGIGLISIIGNFGMIPKGLILLALPLQMFLGYLVVSKKRIILPVIFLLQTPYLILNPCVRGGTDYLYSNPVAQKIQSLQTDEKSPARWIALSSRDEDTSRAWALSNYFRIIGVPALGGYNFPFQKEVFEPLFSENNAEKIKLNQCAFFTFQLAIEGQPPKIQVVSSGNLIVHLTRKQLKDLCAKYNVKYLMVVGDERSIEKNGLDHSFQNVGSLNGILFFRRTI